MLTAAAITCLRRRAERRLSEAEETDLAFDTCDDLGAMSKWNTDFPARAWDTAPETWDVLESLTQDDHSLLVRLQRVRKLVGPDSIDVSVAKVLLSCVPHGAICSRFQHMLGIRFGMSCHVVCGETRNAIC